MASKELNIEEAKRAINELVTHLETSFNKFQISEIIKGGSLGHGTTVAGDFDIDLVIYSRDIEAKDIYDAPNEFQKWLKMLHSFLTQTLGRNYKFTKMTLRSVQFVYKGYIEVDLLVSPFWEDQHEFYDYLKTIPAQESDMFSVCASKWQVEFFKKQPPQVKEYIRKAKDWRNKTWKRETGGEGRPSSYLLSLLVLRAYETKGQRTVTASLKDLVRGAHGLDIYWADMADSYYRRRDYPQLLPSRPRVVDPANPANNVWATGFTKFKPREKPSDYEEGDGNSTLLQRYIQYIDLE